LVALALALLLVLLEQEQLHSLVPLAQLPQEPLALLALAVTA
jgi:hypothetical protein